MEPEKVISPKKHVKDVRVIFTNPDKTFSIALLEYDEVKRVGIRWNGGENEKGYPQSCGHPTWFLLPKAVALAYAEKIGDTEFKMQVGNASDKSL